MISINLKDAYLPIPISEEHRKYIPLIHMEGRIPVSPIWPQQCPMSFHEATKTSDGPPLRERDTEHDIPRRQAVDDQFERRTGSQVTTGC